MTPTLDRRAAWEDLTTPTAPVERFDPATLVDLPGPARRLIEKSIRPGTELTPTVSIQMVGEIKLKRWVPFRARQVIRVGEGFVWEATAGRPPIVFTGGDTFWQGKASLDFRLWRTIPVVRAAGPDIDRSAAGRLAAETAAWAPQGLTPQMGATWTDVDATHATVSLPIRDQRVEVTVAVSQDGRLEEVTMQRWGDPDSNGFALHDFGASVEAVTDVADITIASAGSVGWWWATDRQDDGEFFRYLIQPGPPD
jgi:hypothetical protein